jgi:hypothetical protein
MQFFARRAAVFLTGMTAYCLVACGHAEIGESVGAPPPAAQRARPELGCTERPTATDDETKRCVAHGCHWGPALVCKGIERPPPPDDFGAPTPSCACVCPEDLRDCMLRP